MSAPEHFVCQEVVARSSGKSSDSLRVVFTPSASKKFPRKKQSFNNMFVAGALIFCVAGLLLADFVMFDNKPGSGRGSSGGSDFCFEIAISLAVVGLTLMLNTDRVRGAQRGGVPIRKTSPAPSCQSPTARARDVSWELTDRIEAALADNDTSTALEALMRYEEAGHRALPQHYGLMARGFAKAGKSDHIERLLCRMKEKGVPPNHTVFTSAMDACARADEAEQCEQYFQEYVDAGLVPGIIAYTALITVWARRGNVPRSEEWLRKLEVAGHRVDPVIGNTMIHACSVNGDVAGARRWLERIEQLGYETNVATYTTAIDACAKAGDVKQAEVLFHKLKRGGSPNVVTYSSMIDACARVGDLEGAEGWFAQMIEMGITPNAHCFGALVNACAKGCNNPRAAEAAEMWLERAEKGGYAHDIVIYSCGVDACAKARDPERAERIFRRGQSLGYKPQSMAFCALARAFAHQGDWPKVEQIGREMDAEGVARNEFFVYAQLISYAMAKPRQCQRAEACLRDAASRKVVNEHVGFALARVVGRPRALQLMQDVCGMSVPMSPPPAPRRFERPPRGTVVRSWA